MFLFENLEAYKKACEFCNEVFMLRSSIKDRIIRDQLFRAALSVSLSIAEGQGRYHAREKKQFYNTAKGSLYECVPLIWFCSNLGYIDAVQYQRIYAKMNDAARVLYGLIKSVKDK